jgi:hypothetical protein
MIAEDLMEIKVSEVKYEVMRLRYASGLSYGYRGGKGPLYTTQLAYTAYLCYRNPSALLKAF